MFVLEMRFVQNSVLLEDWKQFWASSDGFRAAQFLKECAEADSIARRTDADKPIREYRLRFQLQ